MEFIGALFHEAQTWLFEALLQPLMFALGLGDRLEDGYAAVAWSMVGWTPFWDAHQD